MKNLILIGTLLLVANALLWSGCATSKVTSSKYVGNWHYTFQTQDGGSMDAIMNISNDGNEFSGYLSSELGSVDLEGLKIENDKLTASFVIESYDFQIEGDFKDDTFIGVTTVEGYEIPMEAKKAKD